METESTTSSKTPTPVSVVPAPVVSTTTNRTITLSQKTRWLNKGSNENSKTTRAVLLYSVEELVSWLTELCHMENSLDHTPTLYHVNCNSQCIYSMGGSPNKTAETYRNALEQGNVVLGIYTYYPGPATQTITSLTAEEDLLTVETYYKMPWE